MADKKPSVIERAKAAWKFYQHGWGAFDVARRPAALETKGNPMVLPVWRDGEPVWQIIDFESYAQEGFNTNAILYSAIMYKVRAITTAPLRAYGGTIDEPELLPADAPLQKLCSRPNRWQSQAEFQGQAEAFLNIAGNVYIAIERQRGVTVPVALHLLRPDRVFIIPSSTRKEIIGFVYVPEGKSIKDGVPFLAQDMIHIKLPNPMDPLEGLGYGLSPISPMARSLDVDNSVTDYLKLFFQNGAMPPGVLSFDVPMDDETVSRARTRWMEIYGGYSNWADVAVLDQGGKYQKIGLSFQELDMGVLDARNESRAVAPLGVPMTLIESRPSLVQSTYSNKETDRIMFWQDTMIPELRWFEVDYQYYLQGDNGEFVMFDLSRVPALTLTPAQKHDLATKAFIAGGLSRNEYRAILPFTLDLSIPDETGKTPQTDTQAGMPEAEDQAEEATDAKAMRPAQTKDFDRKGFWTKTDALATRHEKAYTKGTQQAFDNDRKAILAILRQAQGKALESKATIDYTWAIAHIVEYYSKTGKAADNWENSLDAAIDALVTANVIQLNGEFGHDTPPQLILSQNWLKEYKLKFAQPINDTSSSELSALLEQAMGDGWGVNETVKHVDQMFEQWMTGTLTPEDFAWIEQRMPFYRTEMIVRTETMRAANASANSLYANWGVKKKEWLTQIDGRQRTTHEDIDGQVVAIDKAFDVGGNSLRFPGDPRGNPSETINCRCTILPVL